MTVHLLKLCVGVSTVDDLMAFQTVRLRTLAQQKKPLKLLHKTRQMPKRVGELRDDGSIYWVIKGVILARQPLRAIEQGATQDGRKCCDLVLDPNLILVQPTPRRPFQGWRYLEHDDVPTDLTQSQAQAISLMPEKMRRDLVELALI